MGKVGRYVTLNVSNIFPEGTLVNAYERRTLPIGHSGAPVGSPILSSTVSNGTLVFSFSGTPKTAIGLQDDESYVAVAQVNGTWRYVGFATKPDRDTELEDRLTAGYNPSVDQFPESTNKWTHIDFVMEVNKGTGNRLHVRSVSMVNVNDPAELIIRTIRHRDGGTSPFGYGPNDDGTGDIHNPQGSNLGFISWQPVIPQGSFQGHAVRIGGRTVEEARQDALSVTLASEVTLPQSEVAITGDMDAVTANDETHSFHPEGEVRIGGQRVTYAGRSSTELFGCAGGTGTFPAGQSVVQTITKSGGAVTVRTARRGTRNAGARFGIDHDGTTVIGERIASNNDTMAFFAVSGGRSRFRSVPSPTNFTATVIGTPGTATITWYLVGNVPQGGQTEPVSVTITDAPNTLDDTNYVKLAWSGGLGVTTWDVIRESTDGLPADTGAIILRQPNFGKGGSGGGAVIPNSGEAVDRGQPLVGVNEVQTVQVLDATTGQFRLGFSGGTTNPIDLDTTAADFQSKLEALGSVGAGNVAVEKAGISLWRVTFQGTLAATNVAQIVGQTHTLENVPTDVEEDEEEEQPVPPAVVVRTRVQGSPSVTYTKPTRNSTADLIVDGRIRTEQGFEVPELAADPDAPVTNEVRIFAKDTGAGKTALYARFATGAIVQIAVQP